MLFQPVHHTFAPLADRQQCLTALGLLFQPWKWKEGSATKELEEAFSKRFNGEAFAFGSGRESLLAILQALTLKREEEVIVQGYTCIVVPNAIIAAGMKPVYVDIEQDTLNLDIDEVEKAITPQTRAIICQHTFGIPGFTKQLRQLCDRHSLLLIEDCAHIIPDETGPQEIGVYGDLLFFSFGRDKAISGVSGGMVVCKNKAICSALKKLQQEAEHLSLMTIKRLLFYPLLYNIALPLYGIFIGKAFLALCGKLRLFVPIVSYHEKVGQMQAIIHRIPNACAQLALQQHKKIRSINDHRRMLTAFYFEECNKKKLSPLLGITPDLPLQKFPLFLEGAEKIRHILKQKNIILYDGWTGCTICRGTTEALNEQSQTVEEAVGYRDGMDPDADMTGEFIFNLPTHPKMSLRDAKKLVKELDKLL